MEGLLRIGDFGAAVGLSVKALRHYDEIGLLEPDWVDPVSGYRWYRPDQARRATAIRMLRALDLPLTDVGGVLDAPDAAGRAALLDRHRARLQSQVDEVGRRLAAIAALLEEKAMDLEVTHTSIGPVTVVSQRISGPPGVEQAMTAVAIAQLMAPLREQGIQPIGVPILLVHGGDETTFDQEACLPVPEGTEGSWVLEGTRAGVVERTGPPEGGQAALHALIADVVAEGHTFRLPFRIRLLAMPPMWGDGEAPRFELAVPYSD